jgi:hypothetical protein
VGILKAVSPSHENQSSVAGDPFVPRDQISKRGRVFPAVDRGNDPLRLEFAQPNVAILHP